MVFGLTGRGADLAGPALVAGRGRTDPGAGVQAWPTPPLSSAQAKVFEIFNQVAFENAWKFCQNVFPKLQRAATKEQRSLFQGQQKG